MYAWLCAARCIDVLMCTHWCAPADGASDTLAGWKPVLALDWYVKLRERTPIYADRFVPTTTGDS